MRRTIFLATLSALSCQSYQFEPVAPVTLVVSDEVFELAPVLKPNVMLAVDRSGSMGGQLDAACSSTCPTRLSELKQAVASFTALADDRVRLGLTTFPREPGPTLTGAEASCQPANDVRVALPVASRVDDQQASQANRASASQVNAAVQALQAAGGTPTGATLAFLGTRSELRASDFRSDFVLLLTDGLPNCNENNPNDFMQSASACRCQTGGGDCSGNDVRRRGCLDADATVEQVQALHRLGIKTIVVGFGADTNQVDARAVLEQLARAGGVPRTCASDGDCGAGSACTSGRCDRWAFQASNRVELEQVLTTVLSGLTPATCTRALPDRPFTSGAVSLLVDGARVARGPETWSLSDDQRSVTLAPAFCEANHGAQLHLRVAGSP